MRLNAMAAACCSPPLSIAKLMIARAMSHGDLAWEYEREVRGGIVAGVDGSRESIAAMNTAASLARARQCPLHVVSVLPHLPSSVTTPADASARNKDNLRISLRSAEMHDLLGSLEPAGDWSSEAVIGRPARELTSIAERRCAELIILGRRIHGPMDRMLGNETPLQVMRTSSVPVLVVESDIEKLRTVVVAVDFSSSSVRAARFAVELLKGSGTGMLYLVFVESAADPATNYFMRPHETRFPGDVIVWFRRFIDALDAQPGILVEPVVLNGSAVTAVTEFAERVGADMIAAGSHSRGRFARFLLGSVSTGIVRQASCPALIVPPGS